MSQIEYAIVVKSKTRLEQLVARYNTRAQARFYIEANGGDFSFYEQEHETYYASLDEVQRKLGAIMKYKLLEREFVSTYLFSEQHLVVTVGQDGLVANTAKYVGSRPIVAINPDESRYDGVLLPFNPRNFVIAVWQVLKGGYSTREIALAEARLQDGQRLLAFNELFVGAASHTSARYKISFREQEAWHSSSGLLLSTKAGSTAWMSSVFNMVQGVAQAFGGPKQWAPPQMEGEELLFAVREPFASKTSQIELSAGRVRSTERLELTSQMPERGVIFSDGIEQDFLQFNSGAIASLGLAPERVQLVQA